MKKAVLSFALGLTVVAFGASDAKAQTFCLDFTNFCDCLTFTIVNDSVGGGAIRRYNGIWNNQDCAGTSSPMQGGNADLRNFLAGELNAGLGLPGLNFNFTWRNNGTNFDLDGWDGTTSTKFQNNSPHTIAAGACPVGCSPPLKAEGAMSRPSSQQ
jgi:hypothetical protein